MKHILIIEDDLTLSKLFGMKLEIDGYRVSYAHNGVEGLQKLKEACPDLILLDLMMPVMSGEEFLRKLRKDEKNSAIPLIVLTNLSKEEAPKTLWHYGISAYFIKAHHTPKELVALIEKYL